MNDDLPEGTAPLRKVRMSETLFLELGASRVDWGEPDADGFYTPTILRNTLIEDREAAGGGVAAGTLTNEPAPTLVTGLRP